MCLCVCLFCVEASLRGDLGYLESSCLLNSGADCEDVSLLLFFSFFLILVPTGSNVFFGPQFQRPITNLHVFRESAACERIIWHGTIYKKHCLVITWFVHILHVHAKCKKNLLNNSDCIKQLEYQSVTSNRWLLLARGLSLFLCLFAHLYGVRHKALDRAAVTAVAKETVSKWA